MTTQMELTPYPPYLVGREMLLIPVDAVGPQLYPRGLPRPVDP